MTSDAELVSEAGTGRGSAANIRRFLEAELPRRGDECRGERCTVRDVGEGQHVLWTVAAVPCVAATPKGFAAA